MTAATGLIDVHSHFLTDLYVTAAQRAGISQPDGTPSWPTWSEQDHLRLMDDNGIERSMLSISTPGVGFVAGDAAARLAAHVNDVGADLHHDRPDRFGHFATLPLPDVETACLEAVRALDQLGSEGVAVETSTRGVYLADDSLSPLWDLLNDRSAVVFVHPTSPTNWQGVGLGIPNPVMEFLFESGRCAIDLAVRGLITRWPQIRWVFTHSSGVLPALVDRADDLVRVFRPHLLGEESVLQLISRLWFDLAGTPFPRAAPNAAAVFGDGRLVYGSDYCFTAPAAVAAQVQSVDAAPPLASGTWRDVLARNAAALLS